jgi:hypothetical protein
MNETLLFTDGTNHCHALASSVRFSNCHISFNPYTLAKKLFVKLGLVNVNKLFACSHKLSHFDDTIHLFDLNLFPFFLFTTVDIIRLDVGNFVLVVEITKAPRS